MVYWWLAGKIITYLWQISSRSILFSKSTLNFWKWFVFSVWLNLDFVLFFLTYFVRITHTPFFCRSRIFFTDTFEKKKANRKKSVALLKIQSRTQMKKWSMAYLDKVYTSKDSFIVECCQYFWSNIWNFWSKHFENAP